MEELLDEPYRNDIDGLATLMDRVRHFYVDGVVIIAFSLLFYFNIIRRFYKPTDDKLGTVFFIELFIVYFAYYLIFEHTTSKTLGKILNKTKVLNSKGEKPNFSQLLLRTTSRLIPISFITMYLPFQRTLHDLFSGTWVVRVRK